MIPPWLNGCSSCWQKLDLTRTGAFDRLHRLLNIRSASRPLEHVAKSAKLDGDDYLLVRGPFLTPAAPFMLPRSVRA